MYAGAAFMLHLISNNRSFTMTFFRNLFRDRAREREGLRRFVEIEFSQSDRQSEYERLLRESRL